MSTYMNKEYLHYLTKNCGVRGYDYELRSPECTRPDVDIVLHYVDWLNIRGADRVLEAGCGLGRLIKELHDRYGVRPTGLDSFADAIQEAKKRVAAISADLVVGTVQETAFSDQAFDKVICWGVFDLVDQALALREMTRLLVPGGQLLVTGKHHLYEPDDTEALCAERASIVKGIPNHYTDFDAFLQWGGRLGLRLSRARYFLRRGDFMNGHWVEQRPAFFYEYVVLLVRQDGREVRRLEPPVVARMQSQTAAQCSTLT